MFREWENCIYSNRGNTKMKKILLTCDITNREHFGIVATHEKMQVIFDHDQNDGKTKCDPYFDYTTIELCEGCWKYMMENRRYIYAYGAMGYNTYYLPSPNKEGK